jgi:hypothetical protein
MVRQLSQLVMIHRLQWQVRLNLLPKTFEDFMNGPVEQPRVAWATYDLNKKYPMTLKV